MQQQLRTAYGVKGKLNPIYSGGPITISRNVTTTTISSSTDDTDMLDDNESITSPTYLACANDQTVSIVDANSGKLYQNLKTVSEPQKFSMLINEGWKPNYVYCFQAWPNK